MCGSLIWFMGQAFMDDINLQCIRPNLATAEAVVAEGQELVQDWGLPLIAMGRALNTNKCHYYVVDYHCVDRVWTYAQQVDYHLTIPQDDGSWAEIEQLNVADAQKMLGVWSCLAGGDKMHIEQCILSRMETWLVCT